MSSDGNINNNDILSAGNTQKIIRIKNRRKQADTLNKAVIILCASVWIILLAFWIMLYFAGVVGYYGNTAINIVIDEPATHVYTYTLLPVAYALLLISLALCAIAFMFNRMRMRRKTDRYRKSIFVCGGVTILVMIIFLYNYGGYFLW